MNNSSTFRIGSIVYALIIGVFGLNHFLDTGMQKMIPSFMPGGPVWVYIIGALLLLAALSILTGKQTKLAAYLLAAFLLILVLSVHLPSVLRAEDASYRRLPLINLLKDTGLAAAALMIAGSKS